uniref:Lysozyme g n=1 Tax=Esox lucius TaxID=8010 RepID=A0A6Q2ZK70_ESOLU
MGGSPFQVCSIGDITKIDTSGASERTARQDKLAVQGVDASHNLARIDSMRMKQYKDLITRSRAGAALDRGWGDKGNGFGLMQVDKRFHKIVGAWDSEEHVSQGTGILIEFIHRIQAKFPSWPKEHQLKGGISAYNAGDKNVRTYEHMDVGTTGDDYSNDVVARAQWFKSQGY